MIEKLRAYWFHRQGLGGMHAGASEVLERCGWARSVGGSNPYLTLFARAGIGKSDAEAAVATQEIHELPSARGCTHYVPARDYALALIVGQGTSEVAAMNTARKHLGFTDSDLETLMSDVLEALGEDVMNPRQLRDKLGDKVRNFGDEGKKRGQTTSLSLALGYLQAQGKIRRVPINGRLDTEHYAYQAWNPSPLDGCDVTREDALRSLATHYFGWTGPASIANFQWFAGIGVGAARAVLADLPLHDIGDGLLLPEALRGEFESFQPPREPRYSLVSCIDSVLLLRRDAGSLVDPADHARAVFGVGGIKDLDYNPILDRGRVVGLWEYDPDSEELVSSLFVESNQDLKEAIKKTESYIREELGDVRSFSLDSPKSRRPRIEKLREA